MGLLHDENMIRYYHTINIEEGKKCDRCNKIQHYFSYSTCTCDDCYIEETKDMSALYQMEHPKHPKSLWEKLKEWF